MDRQIVDFAVDVFWKLAYHTFKKDEPLGLSIRSSWRFSHYERKARSTAFNYALRRLTEKALPYEANSTFFLDLAAVVVALLKPGEIYPQGSPNCAIGVCRCLLRYEGFEPTSADGEECFKAELHSLGAEPLHDRSELITRVVALLEGYWKFTGEVQLDAFDSVRDFRQLHNNSIRVLAVADE